MKRFFNGSSVRTSSIGRGEAEGRRRRGGWGADERSEIKNQSNLVFSHLKADERSKIKIKATLYFCT